MLRRSLLFLVLLGCVTSAAIAMGMEPGRRDRVAARSRFGIDYVFALAPDYRDEKWPCTLAESGARWVQFAGVSWRAIEPRPPRRGKHTYRWDKLDAAVKLWQKYGFQIAMWLQLGNGWFAGPVRYKPLGELLTFKDSDRLPKPENMDDYRCWIQAVVERYDADGHEDMPGLLRPVLHYQCGNEYANPMFWTGTLDDYVTLLKMTCEAARAACPEVKIISNGLRWGGFFHGDPRAEHFQERWQAFLARLPSEALRAGWQRNYELNLLTVRWAKLVDVIDVGGNGAWPTGSSGYFAWVRQELAKANLSGPPPELWDAEARCEPLLTASKNLCFHPELAVPDGRKILRMLKGKSHPRHEEASRWYRAEQARICVKVFVTRFAAGAQKVLMGMPGDWDATAGSWMIPNPYIGLLSSKGAPWPAYYAMKQLAVAIDGFAKAERVPAGEGIALYRFTFDDGRPRVWVAWLADRCPRGLEDSLPERLVTLHAVSPRLLLQPIALTTQTPPARELTGPRPLTIQLTPTPVILVEQ